MNFIERTVCALKHPVCNIGLKEFQKQGKLSDCKYQESLQEHQLRGKCSTFTNAVEEDWILFDRTTVQVTNSFVDTN